MNVKQIGNNFEKEFAKWLANKGMFVYNLPNKANGQPFDILAAKNNVFLAFECKNCTKDYFPLSRVEDNQIQSFKKLESTGNYNYYFIFNFNGDIRFCTAGYIQCHLDKNKTIHKDELLPLNILEVMLGVVLSK
ncbi:MAG: Holliday junction resolvase RecU [Eubacteriales bacterium]|nr:Holliday junction resolvase RecU [Eubacteriales bacterium]